MAADKGERKMNLEPKMFRHIILHGYNTELLSSHIKSTDMDGSRIYDCLSRLPKAHAFNVSSVCEIIKKVPRNTCNLYPPFPSFWIEGIQEQPVGPNGEPVTNDVAFGLFVEAIMITDLGICFNCLPFEFAKADGVIYGPQYAFSFFADNDGNLKRDKKGGVITAADCFAPNWPRKRFEDDVACDIKTICNFLGLINAKNISCPMRSFQVNDYNKRKLKSQGAHRYHILKIHKPGEKITKDAATGENEGKMPLHIVRGHLRTYDEKGLFGKYFGTFFIPSHVRGEQENGMVTKDYALVSSGTGK